MICNRTKIYTFVFVSGVVVSGAFSPSLVSAQEVRVTEVCANLYRENGAVPRTESCLLDASLSSVGLATFQCTASRAQIESFCNGDLPTFDEDLDREDGESDDGGDDDQQDEDTNDGGEGGDDQQDEDTNNGDDESGGEGGDSNALDDNAGAQESDESIEIIVGDVTTAEPAPLPNFEDVLQTTSPDGSSSGGCSTENPFPTLPGAVDIPLSAGTQFLPNSALSNYGTLSAALTLTNLTSSAVAAQDTGDSSLFFSNIFSIVLPLIPQDSSLGNAFQSFSDFIDQFSGGGCR